MRRASCFLDCAVIGFAGLLLKEVSLQHLNLKKSNAG